MVLRNEPGRYFSRDSHNYTVLERIRNARAIRKVRLIIDVD